jgi:LacI family transcriptional regulator
MDLKQLSSSLGLSPTTVSRALNGYADVSEVTRARVVEAATRLGYAPNANARRLAIGKADAVGLIYPTGVGDLTDPRFLEVVSGLTERFGESDIDLLVATTQSGDELAAYERLVRGRRFDALIVARTRREDPRIELLQRMHFPFLAYGRTADPSSYPWFDFDNAGGLLLALRRLGAFGHRRIGYVHAPLELNYAYQRHEGFRQGLAELGLEEQPAWKVQGFGRRGGYEATMQLLSLEHRPTAIVVDNNLSGVGVARALTDRGLVLGRDLSVIVYDGVPADQLLQGQSMTSIEQPTAFEAGRTMAAMMMDVLAGKPVAEIQQLWTPTLSPGTSDGPV